VGNQIESIAIANSIDFSRLTSIYSGLLWGLKTTKEF
jgi:hypothetical protein